MCFSRSSLLIYVRVCVNERCVCVECVIVCLKIISDVFFSNMLKTKFPDLSRPIPTTLTFPDHIDLPRPVGVGPNLDGVICEGGPMYVYIVGHWISQMGT